MRKSVYRLTAGDEAIFERAIEDNNPNLFTNYYLASPETGTRFNFVPDEKLALLTIPEFKEKAQRWQENYLTLYDVWKQLGKPKYFVQGDEGWIGVGQKEFDAMIDLRRFKVVRNPRDKTHPTFHNLHGFLFLPWQQELFQASQFVRVVVGGYGSGKTLAVVAMMLYYAATLRGFRAFALAPNSNQVMEVYKLAMNLMAGTRYEERFLIKSPTRPVPRIIIQNSRNGDVESEIMCIPVGDDPGKILTLTGDMALVDQAEQLPVKQILRNVGSRFRGQLHGREMLGLINFIANSGDNPELWDLYDEGQDNPREVYSLSPGTHLNDYLTIDDMIRFQRVVGTSEAEHRMYLMGERPIGDGEYFNAESINLCRDPDLLTEAKNGTEAQEPGYVYEEAARVGVYRYELPYDPDSVYIVVADPGWANPPNRNSAAIGVFKIGSALGGEVASFPHIPASLVAFHWVFGNNSPNPWLAAYDYLVKKYHAIGHNGFDSTGIQSGYERLPTGLSDLMPTPIPLNGSKKYAYLTITRKMVADGKFRLPELVYLMHQMSHYKLPDDKIPQDLVMMLLCAGAMLEQQWYLYMADDANETVEDFADIYDRYSREVEDRYGPLVAR